MQSHTLGSLSPRFGVLLSLAYVCFMPFASAQTITENYATQVLSTNLTTGDNFGYSIGIDHDIMVVGAPGRASKTGVAYVFYRNQGGGDSWGQVTQLSASDAAVGDQFGYSVAVNGSAIVVGAPGKSSSGANAGAIYIFQKDQGGTDTWDRFRSDSQVTSGRGTASDKQ